MTSSTVSMETTRSMVELETIQSGEMIRLDLQTEVETGMGNSRV